MPYPSSQYNNLKSYTITPGMTVWIDPGKNNSYDPANTRILDLSGNNNHLNLVNGPSVLLDQFGGILKFDGTSDWAYITNNPTINFPNDFTVESWEFRPIGDTTGFLGGIQKRGFSYTVGGWSTLAYEDSGFMWRNFDSAALIYTVSTPFKIYQGNWYHFVALREQGYIKLYVNGELRITRSVSENYNYTNTENLEVSRWGTIPTAAFSFGPIRIYQSALTAEQVKNHYLADVNRFLKTGFTFNNTISYQEDKNFNSQRANVRRSAAKYSTDVSVGTINTFAPYKNQLEDLTNQFVKFSDGISPKFRLSTAYNAMTADQKDYFSNVSQETINNAFEDLDELNKLTTELQRTILLLKSQTLTLDGVYPSSKYR